MLSVTGRGAVRRARGADLTLVYIISVIGSGTTAGALAAIAPHLKEAALRIAAYFAAAAEHAPDFEFNPTWDKIQRAALSIARKGARQHQAEQFTLDDANARDRRTRQRNQVN